MFRSVLPGSRAFLLAGFFSAIAVSTTAMPAAATVVIIPSLEEMTRRSDVVVHGRVGEIRVSKREHGIFTAVDVEVLDGWKGAKTGDVVTLYQRGGEFEGRHEHIVGQHEWVIGEEFVIFGVHHDDGIIPYGVGVGKFAVDRSAEPPVVDEVLGDVVAAEPAPGGTMRMVNPVARSRRALGLLKADVVEFAAKGQLKPGERLSPISNAPKIKRHNLLGKLPGEER